MPPLSKIIYVVCERTAPGLFGEPLNTLSGIGFLVAAWLLFKLLCKQDVQPRSAKFLITMVALVGLGSSVFHSTSRMWAAAFADALPIAVFSLSFIYIFSRRVLHFRTSGALGMILLFILTNIIFKTLVHRAPDGYISVMPTMFYMIMLSLYMMFAGHPARIRFGIAVIVACIATVFRILDWPVCAHFSHGTHFLWHSLMAVFMYLSVREVLFARSKI